MPSLFLLTCAAVAALLYQADSVHDYPPYFKRQPPHEASCSYYNFRNIEMFGNNQALPIVSDDVIKEIGVLAQRQPHGLNMLVPEVVVDKSDHHITNMRRFLFNFLFPLAGMRTFPPSVGVMPGRGQAFLESKQKEERNHNLEKEDQIMFNNRGGTGGVGEVNAAWIRGEVNKKEFVGFIIDATSSHRRLHH